MNSTEEWMIWNLAKMGSWISNDPGRMMLCLSQKILLTQVCYFPFKTTKQIAMLDVFLFKHSSTRGYGFCQDNKQKKHRHKWQRHVSDSGRKRGKWWRRQGKGDMVSLSVYISSQKGKIGELSDHSLQGTRKHWKSELAIPCPKNSSTHW